MHKEVNTECELNRGYITQTRVASAASEQLQSSVPFVGLRNTLPSDVSIISSFVNQLMTFIARFRTADDDQFEIETAVREALANAIVHGNQNDPSKLVYVNCRCARNGEVSITVEDEGNGFEIDAVPDPTSPANQLRSGGRGIYLIRTLMDEVDFEQGGSVVHMRKRVNAGSETTRKPQ